MNVQSSLITFLVGGTITTLISSLVVFCAFCTVRPERCRGARKLVNSKALFYKFLFQNPRNFWPKRYASPSILAWDTVVVRKGRNRCSWGALVYRCRLQIQRWGRSSSDRSK